MSDMPQFGSRRVSARLPRATRAFRVSPAYWFTMFAASALGTNLGDFWADRLFADRWVSFASLVAICGLGIAGDRRIGRRSDVGYWIAIVGLRAAATIVADFLTHDCKLGYVATSIILGVATLLAGYFTRLDEVTRTSPTIDMRYWTAMLVAGVFGTTAGDLASHMIGLYAAAGMLCVTLVVVIGLRARFAPTSVLAYWCIVLVERCAGTPVGDGLASSRAVGLGLPLAIVCTTGLLVVGLLVTGLGGREPVSGVSGDGR
jgi:uncharacterized membrane-anchored protein